MKGHATPEGARDPGRGQKARKLIEAGLPGMGVTVKPSFRVHGFIYGDAGNAGMGVYCETSSVRLNFWWCRSSGMKGLGTGRHFFKMFPMDFSGLGTDEWFRGFVPQGFLCT